MLSGHRLYIILDVTYYGLLEIYGSFVQNVAKFLLEYTYVTCPRQHSPQSDLLLKGKDKYSLKISKRNAPLIEPDEVCGCCCWLASSFEVTELHISNIGKVFGITSLERGLIWVTAVHIAVQIVVNPICNILPIKQNEHWIAVVHTRERLLTKHAIFSLFLITCNLFSSTCFSTSSKGLSL